MRRIALILLLVAGSVPVADAWPVGRIAIFSDEALTNTTLDDDSMRAVDIYIAHVDHYGVTGSRFKIEAEPGFTGIWLGETSPWAPNIIGTSTTGVSIYYAQCAADDIVLIKSTYWLLGTSQFCTGLTVVPDPGANGYTLCTGCNFVELPCGPPGALRVGCPAPVPVQESTWGRVKALYR
jgi:hypothetical protein